MKNLVVINTQAFGDCLLSTHIARLAKKYIPDIKVHFFIRADLTLTTAETSKEAFVDVLKILSMQTNIASVGVIVGDSLYPAIPIDDFKVILIQGWSSDLGLVRSQLKPFYDMFDIKDKIDTETIFNVNSNKTLTTELTVGLAGDVDFLRKWQNPSEYQKFLDHITQKKYHIRIEKFGVDVESTSYSEQLKRLNNCDLLISPMGSLVHAAAGLNVSTISLTSVFPAEYDCPEFYHTGWHTHIKTEFPNHCGTFKCVTPKTYDNQQSWGNPYTEMGFWPAKCPYTDNKQSCVFNITANNIIEQFERWYDEHS